MTTIEYISEEPELVSLSELTIGDCFFYSGVYYMKVSENVSSYFTILSLQQKVTIGVGNLLVVPVNAKIIIEPFKRKTP